MYFLIGADFVPTKSNIELFKTGDVSSLVGKELEKVLVGASYRIFNLEVPITDEEKRITKQGPNLIASTDSVEAYKALGVDLFTLANNHILDQGEQGLRSTINILDSVRINHVGAGKDLADASAPFIFTFAKQKIGVYGCAEHEFSIADELTPGANPFDPLWSFDHVQELKKECDFVIVLYHGGKEHYRYPSPNLQRTCRRLIDKGANLVVCQHSHSIGCEEKYNEGTIVYGQGNFLFDDNDSEFWKTGMLIKIEDDYSISYIPLLKVQNTVRLADEKNRINILQQFKQRSREISTPGFVKEQYQIFAGTMIDSYLEYLLGKKTIVYRACNRISRGQILRESLNRKYQMKNCIRIQNCIECEAHRELFIEGLKGKLKKECQQF